MVHTVKSTLIEGSLVWLLGITVAAGLLYIGGWFDRCDLHLAVGRRWGESCAGWDDNKCIAYIIGCLLHWWAYATIAFVIWRLHPVIHTIPLAQVTISGVGAFILGCGVTHLVAAYVVFHPVYWLEIAFLWTNGIVSCVLAVLVAMGLVRVFSQVKARREQLEKLERRVKSSAERN